VRAFLAQRLVRRLCPNCKTPHELTVRQREELEIPAHITGQCYDAVGCDRCRGTGFSGRLAIYEVVLLTEEMQDLIVKGEDSRKLMEQAVRDGFVPMREYGWHKCLAGDTTLEEVISVTSAELC